MGLDSTDQSITAYRLLLAKLDRKTNVEWFESVIVPAELLERNGIPVSELSLLTMGILVWRCTLNNARLLCLVNGVLQQLHEDSSTITASFEALKRAACKYKCMHHVITVGQRRPSAASTHSSCSSRRPALMALNNGGRKMRQWKMRQ
uniref:NR LBD domain-containing protein n=1 Tax=Globodera pallida TaxID=36090 RepID=A0A183BQ28_GLOPA